MISLNTWLSFVRFLSIRFVIAFKIQSMNWLKGFLWKHLRENVFFSNKSILLNKKLLEIESEFESKLSKYLIYYYIKSNDIITMYSIYTQCTWTFFHCNKNVVIIWNMAKIWTSGRFCLLDFLFFSLVLNLF